MQWILRKWLAAQAIEWQVPANWAAPERAACKKVRTESLAAWITSKGFIHITTASAALSDGSAIIFLNHRELKITWDTKQPAIANLTGGEATQSSKIP